MCIRDSNTSSLRGPLAGDEIWVVFTPSGRPVRTVRAVPPARQDVSPTLRSAPPPDPRRFRPRATLVADPAPPAPTARRPRRRPPDPLTERQGAAPVPHRRP